MYGTRTPKNNFLGQGFRKSLHYRQTDRQTDAFAVVITCEQSFLETGGLRLQAINVYGGIRRRLPENWPALFAARVIQCGHGDCSRRMPLPPHSAAVICSQPHNVFKSPMMGTNYLSSSYNYF